jgi:hypothetical protein
MKAQKLTDPADPGPGPGHCWKLNSGCPAYLGDPHLYKLEPCDSVCGGESNLAGEQHPNGGWHHAQFHNIQ